MPSALPSLWMAEEEQEREATQLSQPKKGKPIEIPVPKRGDFEQLVTRAAKAPDADDQDGGEAPGVA